MTIDELIDELADARHELGGQAQVRIAHQPGWPLRATRELDGQAQVRIAHRPGWPLRATVACVTVPGSDDPDELNGEGEAAPGQDGDGQMCWLAAGDPPWHESAYAPRWACQHGQAGRP
jgi:hypothetical protein